MPGDKSKISGMVLVMPWIVTIFENIVQFHLVNSDSWGGGEGVRASRLSNSTDGYRP